MANKSDIIVILLVIIGFSFIIIFPISFLSINLSSYGLIEYSDSFTYKPSSPSSIEKLYINADEGNVEIKYVSPPVEYFALIDVNITLSGEKLAGKSYEDYIKILWDESGNTANLTLEIVSNDWFNPSLRLIKEVNILVTLKKDIVFDIITNLTKGNFKSVVPWGVATGDILTNVSNGNILYNFEQCFIQGNIIGNINDGDLIFKSNNVQYTQNSSWNINTREGNLHIEIFQYREIGANITGIFKVNSGDVFILYKDDSANIGAILEIPYGDTFMDRGGLPLCIRNAYNTTCTEVEGFDYDQITSDSVMGTVNFTSFDLLANIVKNYYSMRFEIIHGSFSMSLSSDPKFK